jgi:excisionase family DNA binding protein
VSCFLTFGGCIVFGVSDAASEWLTQEEAAERLHIALDTMRRYVREGRFARTKVGKRYLIPARAIEEFLQGGLVTGPREVKPRKEKPAVKTPAAGRKR